MMDLNTAPTIQDMAEGPPESPRESDSSSPLRTGESPALRIHSERGAPSAETGTVAAVMLAEGRDNTDSQDATRTTAEQQISPARESELTKIMTSIHPDY